MAGPAAAGDEQGVSLGTAPDGRPLVLCERPEQWRAWLVANHERVDGVWLVSWRSSTGRPRVGYEEAIEEALCVGWIDSHIRRMDDERTRLLYTPRRRGSVWSALNKRRVERLASAGRILPAGQATIDRAKADGTWEVLDAAERLEEPDDLRDALAADPLAARHWAGWPPSARKVVIALLATARRPVTRRRRLDRAMADLRDDVRPGTPRRD